MKTLLTLLCAAAGLCAAAAPVVELSPAAWRGAKVERLQRAVRVKDAGGKPLLEISAEPYERIDGVTVTVVDDHVSIDANEAFKAGMGKLVCMTAPVDVPAFAGEALMYEVRVAGPEARPVTCGVVSWKEGAEGRRQFHYEACNGRKPYQLIAQGRSRVCRGMVFMPERTGGYRIRFDFTQGGGMPFAFYGGSLRLFSESRLPPDLSPAAERGQLMFHAPFDGSLQATFAKGSPSPLCAEGVSFAPGLKGQALRVSPQAKSMLQYAFPGNAIPEHGAVSLWFRSERPADAAPLHGMGLFATDYPFNGRSGTGSLYLWRWGERTVRGDISNDADLYATRKCELDDGKWHHAVLNWDRAVGVSLWVDGYFAPSLGGVKSVDLAFAATSYSASDVPGLFDRFCVGSWRGGSQFHGLIDDLRIYSAPLGKDQVESLRREIGLPPVGKPDYAALSAARGRANPYVAPPQAKAGTPGRLELVREWRFDRLPPAPGFKSFGKMSVRSLGGVPYIEAGEEEDDRFRMTFDVDPKVPFHILEFDYPDDRKRTMDIIVQDATGDFWDYALQVGVLTGGDAPVSGKMRTHRCIYWTRAAKVGMVAMTARKGGAAALAAFRVLKPVDGALPEARIAEPRRKDGWGRTMAIYYEDAAINYDFSVPTQGYSPESALEMADRLVAVMKFTGQNLLAYPGAWYEGPIDERYNPRDHAPDFLSAFYERFDAAGLGVMPLINQHRMADADPAWITAAGLLTGAIHQTPVSEGASGFPQSHGTMGPALYNIAHPLMRKYYSDMIDRFIRQGAGHPSFRGVGIHLKYPSLTWFGTLDGGYNDYCVDAFEKATGVRVPVDRASSRRSRDYARWLKANAYEKWVQWRCDVCTGFWVEMARKLAAARPDLKLWINDITPLDPHMEGFRDRDYMRRTAREGGMDRERLAREAPNVILGQTTLPADYRFTEGRRPGFYFATPADREHQRTMHLMPEFWDFVKGGSYAIAHQHDRYWEAATGNPKRNTVSGAAISGPDFDEHNWRVSTLNPPGRYALQHFAQALLHQDMLGLSKGGYLVGTYGMEEQLAPFAQAFRALPPVMMETLPGGGAAVRLRFVRYDGRSWFYLVNTSAETVRVKVNFPSGTSDLVTDEKFSGAFELELAPYELRSFGSASGRPSMDEDRQQAMAAPGIIAAAGEPILWMDGTWDATGAPVGSLLSDNGRWYGDRIFTGVTYEWEEAPNSPHDGRGHSIRVPGRRLLNRMPRVPEWNTVGRKGCKPVTAVFDFKRPCRFTEVDLAHQYCTNALGFVQFSHDRTNWTDRLAFDSAGAHTRIRPAAPVAGRYLRLSFRAKPGPTGFWLGPCEGHTLLDEVFVWGDAEVSAAHPEPMDETTLGGELQFTNAVRGAVSILPMPTPRLSRKPAGATPDVFRLAVARNETETRYFAVVNGTDTEQVARLAAPEFGEGTSSELLIGGVLRIKAGRRKLSDKEMEQLATTSRYVNDKAGSEMDVLPFFRAGVHLPHRLMRHYLANAAQVEGFPEVRLAPGEGCVVMLRVTTAGASPGVRRGALRAGGARLAMELRVSRVELPPQKAWIYAAVAFSSQYPYESATRVGNDVRRYVEMGATTAEGLPEPGTKAEMFFKAVTNASAVVWHDWCDPRLLKEISVGRFDKLGAADREKLAAGLKAFLARARELGVPREKAIVYMTDEPGPSNAESVYKAAAFMKSRVPEAVLCSDPLFFRGGGKGFCSDEEILGKLLPLYNETVDVSVPIQYIAESRPKLMEKLWTRPRLINAQYNHPAGRAGLEMVYQCRRCGFNGMAYCSYCMPNGRDPWDIRTYGVLNMDYLAVFPLENDVALTAQYESMREASETWRLLDALEAAGRDDVMREVLERARSAWDRTHIHYMHKDAGKEDILDLRARILEALDPSVGG